MSQPVSGADLADTHSQLLSSLEAVLKLAGRHKHVVWRRKTTSKHHGASVLNCTVNRDRQVHTKCL